MAFLFTTTFEFIAEYNGELLGIVNDMAESDCIYTMTSASSLRANSTITSNLLYIYIYFRTYHDYAKSMGTRFTKPDLAVAFNSGCSESQAVSSWKKTIEFLVQNKIPSVFTVGFILSIISFLHLNTHLTNCSVTIVKRLKRMLQSSRALVQS